MINYIIDVKQLSKIGEKYDKSLKIYGFLIMILRIEYFIL